MTKNKKSKKTQNTSGMKNAPKLKMFSEKKICTIQNKNLVYSNRNCKIKQWTFIAGLVCLITSLTLFGIVSYDWLIDPIFPEETYAKIDAGLFLSGLFLIVVSIPMIIMRWIKESNRNVYIVVGITIAIIITMLVIYLI